MKQKSLAIYFVLLIILSAAWIVGAKLLGEQGRYLAQVYMMTPAIAALITRLFFYENRFKDANLRFGRLSDYGRYWLSSLAITIFSYLFSPCLARLVGISQATCSSDGCRSNLLLQGRIGKPAYRMPSHLK